MSSEEFTVNNYYELLAIHKVMMEARFSSHPNDPEVAGSPVAASLHERVIDKLISIDAANRGESARDEWLAWLELTKDHKEWSVALERAYGDNRWDTWGEMEQRFFAMTLLAPFDVSESLLAEFVNKVHNTRRADRDTAAVSNG